MQFSRDGGRHLSSLALIGFALGTLLTVGGCSSVPDHDLAVTSLKTGQAYSQHFSEAYCSQDDGGDIDLVLTSAAEHPGARAGTLKQVMHVHVLWQPGQVVKPDAAGTNASVRWYVFTAATERPQLIEYAGTGRVAVWRDGGTFGIRITNTSLHPAFVHGQLTDPIGTSDCTGTITAKMDRKQVDRALSEVRTTLAATSFPAEAQAAEARIQMAP